MTIPAATLHPDWPQYAKRLRDGIAGLTHEQLGLRAGPDHAPVWALAAHVAGTRVFWLCGVFGEAGADTTPFPSPLTDPGWEDDESVPRSGSELAWALDSSWEVLRACLERWPVDALDHAVQDARPGDRLHTRASILDRLLSHDAFHAGEISQLLGRHELKPIDLWSKNP